MARQKKQAEAPEQAILGAELQAPIIQMGNLRFEIEQDRFEKALAITAKVARSKTVQEYQHIWIEALSPDRIEMVARNGTLTLRLIVLANVLSEGKALIPAERLRDWVSAMPNKPVSFEVDASNTAKLACATFKASIRGMQASEKPFLPDIGSDANSLALLPERFRQMVKQVIYATADDSLQRPALSGVLIERELNGVRFTTTDGYRLATVIEPLEEPGKWSLIVPDDFLEEVMKLAEYADPEKPIEMAFYQSSQIIARLEGTGKGTLLSAQLSGPQVEGKFPDYRQIIPKSYTMRTTVSRADLARQIRVAAMFSDMSYRHLIEIRVFHQNGSPARMEIKARDREKGDSVSDLDATPQFSKEPERDTQFEDKPLIEIAFSSRYLLDALNVIQTDTVCVDTTQALRPGVLRGVVDGKLDESFLYVVMPMQLTNTR